MNAAVFSAGVEIVSVLLVKHLVIVNISQNPAHAAHTLTFGSDRFLNIHIILVLDIQPNKTF